MIGFGIITNAGKDAELRLTRRFADVITSLGQRVFFDAETALALGGETIDWSKTDVLLILGGDGTVLRAARRAAPHDVKLLGLNLGKLGFLLDAEENDIGATVRQIIAGDYFLEHRMMLSAECCGNKAIALNEFVVSQKQVLKLIRLFVRINGAAVYDLRCDGIITATPTGATGYNLSAGGPILYPTLDNMIITPVCAHTVKARSIVISGGDTVTIRAAQDCMLSADGNAVCRVPEGAEVTIKRSQYRADFIKFRRDNFFSILNRKLTEWD